MKLTCLILAVVALVTCAPGCSPEIEKQPSAAPTDVSSAKADSPGAADVKTAQPKAAPALPIAFVGKWDPYAAYDKKITDRIVMVKRPDCGSCHMAASLSGRQLHLVVDRGNKTTEWTIEGKPDVKTVVFEKTKIRVVLKDGKLSGKFTGKMHANIDLAVAPADQDGQ
jgi:hypothetical protein